MKFTLIAPAYLPAVEYFISLVNCDIALFADHLQYIKRSPISRSSALNQDNYLTVPVKHSAGLSSIKNKQIAQIDSWSTNHLKTIRHQYNNYPFFEDYFTDISDIYRSPAAGLTHFLTDIIIFFLKKLKLNCRLVPTSAKNFSTSLEMGICHFANENDNSQFTYKREYEENGWLNIKQIEKTSIKCLSLQKTKSDPSLNLSILDFLFLHGPEAAFKIRELQRSCFVLN